MRLGVPSYFFPAGFPSILTQRRTIDLGGWNVHNNSDSFFYCLSIFIEAIHLPRRKYSCVEFLKESARQKI